MKIICSTYLWAILFGCIACTRDNGGEVLPAYKEPPISLPANDNTINKSTGFWFYLSWQDITEEQIAREAPRRTVVVMQAWKNRYIPIFKKYNPNIKVLVYKNMSASIDTYELDPKTGDTLISTGVGYDYAAKNHPDWFLLDADNNRIRFVDYDNLRQMDIGNSGYQEYWSNTVTAELVKYAWDGVFIDDVLFAVSEHHPGLKMKQYQTDIAFQTANKSMLNVVQTKLKAAGKMSIGNMTGALNAPGQWNEYLKYMDGALDEWWLVNGPGDYNGGHLWHSEMAEAASAAKMNKLILVQPHSSESDAKGYYYALASYWLVNDGNVSFSEQPVADGYYLPYTWRPEYEWNMGKPLGAYDSVGTNFKYYRRDFTRTVVIVNPQIANISINLDQTYLNEGGQRVSQIIMPPKTGTILRRIFP